MRLLAALSLAVLAAGCSGLGATIATPTPPGASSTRATVAVLTPTPRDPVPGSPVPCATYLTVDAGAPLYLLPGRYLRVSLCEDMIDAYAGCNYLSGKFVINHDRLFASDMDRTLIGCDKLDDDQDNKIQSFLEAGQTVDIEAGWMTMGGVQFFREPVPPTPTGN